jgi:hypothetical protein
VGSEQESRQPSLADDARSGRRKARTHLSQTDPDGTGDEGFGALFVQENVAPLRRVDGGERGLVGDASVPEPADAEGEVEVARLRAAKDLFQQCGGPGDAAQVLRTHGGRPPRFVLRVPVTGTWKPQRQVIRVEGRTVGGVEDGDDEGAQAAAAFP